MGAAGGNLPGIVANLFNQGDDLGAAQFCIGTFANVWQNLLFQKPGFKLRCLGRLRRAAYLEWTSAGAAKDAFPRWHSATMAACFARTADPGKIIPARNRGFQTLESIHWHTFCAPPLSRLSISTGLFPGNAPVLGVNSA